MALVFHWLSNGKHHSSGVKAKYGQGFFTCNITKTPVHHIDLSQDDVKFHIKKGRVNSDLPFLKTKELIIFEAAHRLTKPNATFAVYHVM